LINLDEAMMDQAMIDPIGFADEFCEGVDDRRPQPQEDQTMSTSPLHITPEGNAWAIKLDGAAAPTSIHPTRGQAVAEAYELVSNLEEAEVIVHQPDGSIGRVVTIRAAFDRLDAELIDDSDDPAARAVALRITPSTARLRAGIGKYPIEGADLDADPADLY
jgi:hypothetical protein